MDNQKNTVLWDGQTNSDERPLRRPRQSQNIINELGNLSINTNDTNDEQSSPSLHVQTENIQNLTNIISNSRLSVDAVEWYPPNFLQQPVSIQNRLSRNKVQEPDENSEQQHDLETNYICDAAISITRMKEIINSITYDAGRFEDLLDVFLEIVTPYFEDIDTIDALADMIYEQAKTEASFRYNGARLCNVLQDQCALFGPRLNFVCEKGANNDPNLLGVTYFLAELYTQLHVQAMYGVILLQAMKNLITKKYTDGVKCVCQSLKLSGYFLDVDHKQAVDEIFSLIETEFDSMQGNLKNLFKSVVDLRANNWGHAQNQPSSTNGYPQQNGFVSNVEENGTFDPNESDITEEEREFLANCEAYNDYLSGDFDPDELCDPEPEMDEEIQAAFREFVQLSKR